jgi:hypothetical protein
LETLTGRLEGYYWIASAIGSLLWMLVQVLPGMRRPLGKLRGNCHVILKPSPLSYGWASSRMEQHLSACG